MQLISTQTEIAISDLKCKRRLKAPFYSEEDNTDDFSQQLLLLTQKLKLEMFGNISRKCRPSDFLLCQKMWMCFLFLLLFSGPGTRSWTKLGRGDTFMLRVGKRFHQNFIFFRYLLKAQGLGNADIWMTFPCCLAWRRQNIFEAGFHDM